MATVKMTTAQARKLGIDLTGARAAPVRTTRRTARGPYHTRCTTCGECFAKLADEDRHIEETEHRRFELVLTLKKGT